MESHFITSVHQLTLPTAGISCHAWNATKSMLAMSPNNNEIHIYNTTTWERLHVLTEHDLLVTGIDWSSKTNKIVSCSHDRNAFVWTFESESVQPPLSASEQPTITPATWKPSLVILRIDRAALDVKWSHDGSRFAVTSGAKCVPVCTYDVANDWWVCKMIKKQFKSTVLCCAFHPSNGQLLATGSSDFKMRIFSTFASDVDGTNVNPGPFSGGPQEFGETYCELNSLGWVHAVAWSPSGNNVVFAGHDCTIHVATLNTPGGQAPTVRSVRLQDLPSCSLIFISDTAFISGGHDFVPMLFTLNGKGDWSFTTLLKNQEQPSSPIAKDDGFKAARELFRNKTTRGQDSKLDEDILRTIHDRPITTIRDASLAHQNTQKLSKISTSGLDGRLVVWSLP